MIKQTQVGGDHYRKLKIQPIEFIHGNKISYMEGNVIKYVVRWRDKGGIEDLRKAIWYLERELDRRHRSD